MTFGNANMIVFKQCGVMFIWTKNDEDRYTEWFYKYEEERDEYIPIHTVEFINKETAMQFIARLYECGYEFELA